MALANSAREELRGTGVRVSVIVPGATASSFWETVETDLDLDRMLPPRLVARTVVRLANEPPEGTTEELTLLPPDGLDERQTSFFHSNVILNNRFFVAAENILQLSEETDCVFGEYGEAGDLGSLLIVQYPDAVRAAEGHSAFIRGYLPDSDGVSPHQTENGNWAYSKQANEYVSIVFDAPSAEHATELQSSIEFN